MDEEFGVFVMDEDCVSAHCCRMKAIYFNAIGAVVLTFGIAACVPSSSPPPASVPIQTSAPPPRPAPAPTPSPGPTPTPAPAPTPAPTLAQPDFENYLDAPQTPGTWRYLTEPDETFALFGTSVDNAQAIIRCDRNTRMVGIGRFGSNSATAAMQVRTETRSTILQGSTRSSGRPLVAAELSARDPLLDAMAITKGRFALEASGMPTLYLPAWAEVTRVIEDCR